MRQQMLMFLICIKIHNQVKKNCCNTFTPTANILKEFNTKMYNSDDYPKITPTCIMKKMKYLIRLNY